MFLRKIRRVASVGKRKLVFRLILIVWYSGTFLIAIPIWCRRNPKWCNPRIYGLCKVQLPSDSELEEENLRRSQDALSYLEELDTGSPAGPEDVKVQTLTSLTFAIVAKRRPYPVINGRQVPLRYLTQVTAGLLRVVREFSSHGKNVQIFICDVDEDPEFFQEVIDLSKYARILRKRAYVNEEKKTLKNRTISETEQQKINRSINQEKIDYEFCLNKSIETTLRDGHVILFQDDALPVENFQGMLESILDQLRDRRYRSIFVKLYHPEAYRKIPWYFHAICYSLVLSSLITFAISIDYRSLYRFSDHLLNRLSQFWRDSKNRRRSIKIFLLLSIYWTFLFWCLGHHTVSQVRYSITGSIYLASQESCCIPAVLYSRAGAEEVVRYLHGKTAKDGYSVDHMLDEIDQVQGLITDTNLIRHIGRYTTLRLRPVKSDPW